MRSIKTAMEQVLKRAAAESTYQSDQRKRTLLRELTKLNAAQILEFKTLFKRFKNAEARLRAYGLEFSEEGVPWLDCKYGREIENSCRDKLLKLEKMSKQIVIQMATADNQKQKEMFQYFLKTVKIEFPTLKAFLEFEAK